MKASTSIGKRMGMSSLIALAFAFSVPNLESPDLTLLVLPDLKVSQIATPGGLCIGDKSKVRVTVVNAQMAGVKEKIPVILYVSMTGHQPSSYVGYLEKGIGPNDNSGQAVWFNEVRIPASGSVTLKAVVNPDQEIQETVYNNNQKVITAKAPNTTCGGAQATPAGGANMTLTVYKQGTWSNGQYQAIDNAQVLVTKNGQTVGSGSTNSTGKVTMNSIPKGACTIVVTKNGCTQVNQNYNMPTYNASVNVGMTCN